MSLNEAQKKERSDYLENCLEITDCSQRRPYVFVSYASDNWEKVFKSAVVPMQRQYGMCVYVDKAFDKVNDKWIIPMLRNIRGADMMVAFVSQSYIESYACFLELLTAINNNTAVVFVSLGEQLCPGNTADLPRVERGVKNEILNQGANITANTGRASSDIRRAMQSAYISISTLLQQDVLSKYDIADSFVRFFENAAVNLKSIYDLEAVRGTICSISGKVFDRSWMTVSGAAAVSYREKGDVLPDALSADETASAAGRSQSVRHAFIRSMARQHGGLVLRADAVPLLIGRDQGSCRLVYAENTAGVSRKHCSIAYDAASGEFIVMDLRSTYGTFLADGQRLQANVPYRLKPGGSLYVGDKANVIRMEVTAEGIQLSSFAR